MGKRGPGPKRRAESTGRPETPRWPPDVIGLLSVLTVLLVVFHYFTLVKFGALPPAVKQQSVAAFIRVA